MTDSEILGGIDGIYMAYKISTFTTHSNRLKLSQALDMYYSNRGLPFVMVETTNTELSTPLSTTNPFDVDVAHTNSNTNGAYAFNTEVNSKFRAIFDNPEAEIAEKYRKPAFLNRFSTKDGITNACHRSKILQLIDRRKLKDETFHLSQVLQLSTSSLAMNDNVLRKNCDATVDRFFRYSGNLLRKSTTILRNG